jgi:hypothetical protein
LGDVIIACRRGQWSSHNWKALRGSALRRERIVVDWLTLVGAVEWRACRSSDTVHRSAGCLVITQSPTGGPLYSLQFCGKEYVQTRRHTHPVDAVRRRFGCVCELEDRSIQFRRPQLAGMYW